MMFVEKKLAVQTRITTFKTQKEHLYKLYNK